MGVHSPDEVVEAWAGPLPVTFSRALPARLERLIAHFQVVWSSSWGKRASRDIAPLVGLPRDLPYLRFSLTIGVWERPGLVTRLSGAAPAHRLRVPGPAAGPHYLGAADSGALLSGRPAPHPRPGPPTHRNSVRGLPAGSHHRRTEPAMNFEQPSSLEQLWEMLLASPGGETWLEAWGLDLDQVRQTRRKVCGDLDEVWRTARRNTCLGQQSAETIVANIIFDRRSALARHLRRRGYSLQVWRETALALSGLSWLDPLEPGRRAYARGCEDAQEIDYLRACWDASPMVRDLFALHDLVLDEIEQGEGSFHPSLSLSIGVVESVHLAMALATNRGIQAWMAELGVTAFRLQATITGLDDRLWDVRPNPQEMGWLRPACQEAHLLGSAVVTPEHLLLGLLSEPRGLACRLFGESVHKLRRRLSEASQWPVRIEEMTFSPKLLEICQQAGRDPSAGVLLDCLFEHGVDGLDTSKLREELKIKLQGRLNLEDVSLNGVRLGMTRERVAAILGEPGFEKEEGCLWMYCGVMVAFEEDRVTKVHGDCLMEGEAVALRLGDSWLEVEEQLGPNHEVELAPDGLVEAWVLAGRLVNLQMERR